MINATFDILPFSDISRNLYLNPNLLRIMIMLKLLSIFTVMMMISQTTRAAPPSGPNQVDTYNFILEKLAGLPKEHSFAKLSFSENGCRVALTNRKGAWSRSTKWQVKDVGFMVGFSDPIIGLSAFCRSDKPRCITHFTSDANNFRDDTPLSTDFIPLYNQTPSNISDDAVDKLLFAFSHLSDLCRDKKELF